MIKYIFNFVIMTLWLLCDRNFNFCITIHFLFYRWRLSHLFFSLELQHHYPTLNKCCLPTLWLLAGMINKIWSTGSAMCVMKPTDPFMHTISKRKVRISSAFLLLILVSTSLPSDILTQFWMFGKTFFMQIRLLIQMFAVIVKFKKHTRECGIQ